MRLQITATVTAEPNGSGKDLSNFQEIVHDEDISTGIWKEFTVRGSGHSRGTRNPTMIFYLLIVVSLLCHWFQKK